MKTIEPMEVHWESRTMCNTETSKVISRTDPMIRALAIITATMINGEMEGWMEGHTINYRMAS